MLVSQSYKLSELKKDIAARQSQLTRLQEARSQAANAPQDNANLDQGADIIRLEREYEELFKEAEKEKLYLISVAIEAQAWRDQKNNTATPKKDTIPTLESINEAQIKKMITDLIEAIKGGDLANSEALKKYAPVLRQLLDNDQQCNPPIRVEEFNDETAKAFELRSAKDLGASKLMHEVVHLMDHHDKHTDKGMKNKIADKISDRLAVVTAMRGVAPEHPHLHSAINTIVPDSKSFNARLDGITLDGELRRNTADLVSMVTAKAKAVTPAQGDSLGAFLVNEVVDATKGARAGAEGEKLGQDKVHDDRPKSPIEAGKFATRLKKDQNPKDPGHSR